MLLLVKDFNLFCKILWRKLKKIVASRCKLSLEFFMLIRKELRIVLGHSRVTGVRMNLWLEGLGTGVSLGWSFILRSKKARLLSAFNTYFIASVYLLHLICYDSKRKWIKREKLHRFYPVFLSFEKSREYRNILCKSFWLKNKPRFWLHVDTCDLASHGHIPCCLEPYPPFVLHRIYSSS